MEISPILDICYANIFSHFVGGLLFYFIGDVLCCAEAFQCCVVLLGCFSLLLPMFCFQHESHCFVCKLLIYFLLQNIS